ncbi:MAG: hypothetical protein ACOC70_03085 [bacterium]
MGAAKRRRTLTKLGILALLLLGLPLLGAGAVDATWREMFELPQRAAYVDHQPFSWLAFALIAGFVIATAGPSVVHALRARRGTVTRRQTGRFPWWGWAGLALMIGGWVLAWSRFPWFAPLQPFTYAMVWFPFILVVNGLHAWRAGHCLMRDRPAFFALLFPTSALFWWFFEYLNRFVQNWRYTSVEFEPLTYVVHATIAFSTVLPAVLSIRELLLSVPVVQSFRSWRPVGPRRPRAIAGATLLLTAVGLACIGVFPNFLFPLLWISPLLIIVSLQALFGDRHVLSALPRGDWRRVVSAAAAALACGLFWEMWNYHSLAKWHYDVPFVERFHLFEMPLLGYAGYLPFGLECAAAGQLVSEWLRRDRRL